MIETKYRIGDVVNINKKEWIVEQIRMRFGKTWVYGLVHETKDGEIENMTTETSSLEKMLN